MKTRTFLAVASGMLMLGGAAVAQTRPTNRPTVRPNAAPGAQQRFQQRHPMMRLLAQLNLTEAQKQQIQGFFQTAQAQGQAIRQDTSLTPEQKRARMQRVTRALHESILGVLTPEQKEKLAQLRRRGQVRDNVQDRLMEALQRLDLTAEQKTEIRKIAQEQREKARMIRESSMADADKRARMQALIQETRQRILSLLTPEQRAKLEAMRPGPAARPKAGPRPGPRPNR